MLSGRRKYSRIGKTLPIILSGLLAGLLIVYRPAIIAVVAALVVAFIGLKRTKLRTWQFITIATIMAYASLNYGFTNFSLFYSVPIGHLAIVCAVILTASKLNLYFRQLMREPAFLLISLFVLVAVVHLFFDIRNYGWYAVRDANFAIEILVVYLGFFLALEKNGPDTFQKSIGLLFLITFIYSLSFPFKEELVAISPMSALFHEVTLLGSYAGVPLFLVSGSLFFVLVAMHKWPKYAFILAIFGLLQVGWSFMFQDRSMYVGIILSLIIVLAISELKLAVKITGGVVMGVLGLFSFLNLALMPGQGRVAEVEFSFFWEHLQSVFFAGENIGIEQTKWRFQLWSEVFANWRSSYHSIFFGIGFGNPLIDYVTKGNISVRQPHNTHLTVLARMGATGFILWVALHARIIWLIVNNIIKSKVGTTKRNMMVWLLLFYMLGLLHTSVQPWMEFSYGVIPFFFIAGFALGQVYLDRNANTLPS